MTEQCQPGRQLFGPAGAGELASVTATEYGAVLVLTMTGELDISNVDRIASVIHALPNTEEGLLIDLTDVLYLDSSAISLLHDLAMRLRNRAQRLIVVSPASTPPRRVLDLTALSVNAPVADTLADGLELLGSDGGAQP